jgi:hypothetical protein
MSGLSDESAGPFVPHLSRERPPHATAEPPGCKPSRVPCALIEEALSAANERVAWDHAGQTTQEG